MFVTHNSAEAILLSDRVIVMPESDTGDTTNITISLDRPRSEKTESDEIFNQLIKKVRSSYKC